ncbi:TPA: terminase family protein [Klebsiella pneumoniae]|nr:terminase family protein [Klebsiella pneumoniae]
MIYSFTPDQLSALKKHAALLFSYQNNWLNNPKRARHYTKMRQCGADFAFSLEALIDAIETGRNQVFIGTSEASTNGANRNYIAYFAGEVGVNITGRKGTIELSNGASIYFVGEKSPFSALCGNAYVSEYAWAKHPRSLFAAAKSVAMHRKHRLTSYTSPSRNEEALKVWAKIRQKDKETLTLTDHMRESNPLLSREDIDYYRSIMSCADFRMMFMCEWQQDMQEQMK